jgi:hypothetical protein
LVDNNFQRVYIIIAIFRGVIFLFDVPNAALYERRDNKIGILSGEFLYNGGV